jgi:hypothetical protein
MKHKKNQLKKEGKKETIPSKMRFPKWLAVVVVASILLNIAWLTLTLIPGKSVQKDLELAASRGAFSLLTPKIIQDDENRSFSIKFAELWENKLQRMNGYICEFPMRSFPACSIILDGELKIISIGSLADINLAGKSYYLGGYFSKFYGIDIRGLAGNSGIFKPDETELTVYSEQFKTGLLKAMKLVYIKVKGESDFEQLFPNGMNLASVGDFLKKFSATDSKGANLSISDLQGKKNAIISVDVGCGSCMSKCALMRDLLTAGDVNVIFVLDSNEQDEDSKGFIKNYVQGEKVIFDADGSISRQLYMNEPPYLMLIGKDLMIHFKEKINDVTKDAEPAINNFLK